MTWSLYAPYLYRQVELGKMTKEKADEQLKFMMEIDNEPELIVRDINVIKEDGEVVAHTNFTDESKNLEVWEAIGLQEEDFYREVD